MTESDTHTILSDAFLTVLYAAGPIMAIALVVGLLIAFFQALTQIQEMTLVFVPKILAVFLSLLIFMPFMINNMTSFMDRIAQRIVALN